MDSASYYIVVFNSQFSYKEFCHSISVSTYQYITERIKVVNGYINKNLCDYNSIIVCDKASIKCSYTTYKC